jgi:hypothetical protein
MHVLPKLMKPFSRQPNTFTVDSCLASAHFKGILVRGFEIWGQVAFLPNFRTDE